MEANKITVRLDTIGKCCPEPMIRLNKIIKGLKRGESIELVATDPATKNDIESWCKRTGNKLIKSEFNKTDYIYYYVIECT